MENGVVHTIFHISNSLEEYLFWIYQVATFSQEIPNLQTRNAVRENILITSLLPFLVKPNILCID